MTYTVNVIGAYNKMNKFSKIISYVFLAILVLVLLAVALSTLVIIAEGNWIEATAMMILLSLVDSVAILVYMVGSLHLKIASYKQLTKHTEIEDKKDSTKGDKKS